jgi:hypothetical protein
MAVVCLGTAGYDVTMVRLALALVVSWLGWACASHEPEPPPEHGAITVEPLPMHRAPEPAAPPRCPPGTELREQGGEGPDRNDWWCARGEVRHGPFLASSFDEWRRNWFEVRGEHVDGQLHGFVRTERHHGGSFQREWFDHGRLVRSNEAATRVDLEAGAPVVTRRFRVKASGLAPTAPWQGEPPVIGSFDVEVWSSWADAPAGASPSVLRVELSAPDVPTPARADALLYSAAETEPPATASDLPLGYAPPVTATWRGCDPAGCELELAVTLRWIAPGPGRVEAHVTARAVPDTWPEAAPIEVHAIDEGVRTP